eukprot:TRINITY_DN1773_c0_g1_i4.p1 TRINITY_DN1773_c0_g1~~TRINITY_DN1773_c0_g1_i4.p1  ORF type:complete len:466 (+),score=15.75 TRINITY_DN1773_c0_g1_i4:405-1802(+)
MTPSSRTFNHRSKSLTTPSYANSSSPSHISEPSRPLVERLLPALPNDVGVQCLARVPLTTWARMRCVSYTWHRAMLSDVIEERKRLSIRSDLVAAYREAKWGPSASSARFSIWKKGKDGKPKEQEQQGQQQQQQQQHLQIPNSVNAVSESSSSAHVSADFSNSPLLLTIGDALQNDWYSVVMPPDVSRVCACSGKTRISLVALNEVICVTFCSGDVTRCRSRFPNIGCTLGFWHFDILRGGWTRANEKELYFPLGNEFALNLHNKDTVSILTFDACFPLISGSDTVNREPLVRTVVRPKASRVNGPFMATMQWQDGAYTPAETMVSLLAKATNLPSLDQVFKCVVSQHGTFHSVLYAHPQLFILLKHKTFFGMKYSLLVLRTDGDLSSWTPQVTCRNVKQLSVRVPCGRLLCADRNVYIVQENPATFLKVFPMLRNSAAGRRPLYSGLVKKSQHAPLVAAYGFSA